MADLLRDWIGKTQVGPHPALWHMLDVAAVAIEIWRHRPLHSSPAVRDAVAIMVALHDLGKFSHHFQRMIQHGTPQPHGKRHWQLTAQYICGYLDQVLEGRLSLFPEYSENLVAAIACHHGSFDRGSEHDPDETEQAAIDQVMEILFSLFPQADLSEIPSEGAIEKLLAWQLNGLLIQSDWIGSNTDWFPVGDPDLSPHDYWQQTCLQAKNAVAQAGLFQSIASSHSPSDILAGYTPRPLQDWALSVSIPTKQSLFFIEDTTGAGKTEAAFILAKRMIDAGLGRGVFIGMPTMATSNAIFDRISAAKEILLANATLNLTHSKARLHVQSDTDDISPLSWLTDDKRRILFSDIAVGTIDQAFMGILPTRFCTLRLWALANKIMIIDEAHSYDPYMQAELEALLSFHRYMGGSAIVLTATLPSQMKAALIRAWDKSLSVDTAPYPAATIVSDCVKQTQIGSAPECVKTTKVVRLADQSEAISLIVQAVQAGASVAWVRNAVDDAISAAQTLAEMGIPVDLLHARFTGGDRTLKEQDLIHNFGKNSVERAGRVVVATQVIEQSLDLDFDVMVSDLAPIGALIQRAGRLWRHHRPTRPISEACLHILSPDPDVVTGENWLSDVLDAGAWVYDVTTQWRTAKVIFAHGAIHAPANIRVMIEAVHDTSIPLPAVLENAQIKLIGKSSAERDQAHRKVLMPDLGITQLSAIWEEEVLKTRLGKEQVTRTLARMENGTPLPYSGTWHASEVSIAKHRIENILPQLDAAALSVEGVSEFAKVVTVAEDGAICDGLHYDRRWGLTTLPK